MHPISRFLASRKGIITVGGLIGLLAVLLQKLGNPPNMGVCVACFTRDIAGAIGLHRAAVVQYMRPEIIGFVGGSMLSALIAREWRPRTGSAPIVRFLLGIFAMVGALVFLGCPWRALLRLAGGDLNSLVGLGGLVVGVGLGGWFLKRGYTLGRSQAAPAAVGWSMPLLMLTFLLLLVFGVHFKPDQAIFFSAKGPGAMHAPLWISLGVGLLIGAMAQRTRFCTMGAIRDTLLIRDTHLLSGIAALVIVAFAANVALGAFHIGYSAMPVSHSNWLWNFLGMVLAGCAFALAGGCPGRQLILSGEGDGDAAVFVLGMLVGAALSHNWFLAAGPDKLVDGTLQMGGPGIWGQVAVLLGLVFCVALGITARQRR